MLAGVPKKMRDSLLVLVAFNVLLCMPGRIYPQVAGGTISGTVTDASGAVIPNTQISIKNVATGLTRAVTADTAGFYTGPNLLREAMRLRPRPRDYGESERQLV